MGMSQSYGPNPGDRNDMIGVLRYAVEHAGITFFDTAEVYGPYVNEELVGEALAPLRDQVVIATKFGWNIVDGKMVGHAIRDRADQARRRRIAAAAGDRRDRPVLPTPSRPQRAHRGRRRRGRANSSQAGKVRHFGLSEAAAETIKRAHAVQPVTAVQSEYSLWTRDPEPEVLPTCGELGIGFVPFSPLGQRVPDRNGHGLNRIRFRRHPGHHPAVCAPTTSAPTRRW